MHCLSFKKFSNQLCCAVFLDMQSFLMPPNYFDDGYLAIFLRQLSRRGLLLFYCSQKLTEADTPSSFVVQRSALSDCKKKLHQLQRGLKTPSIYNGFERKKWLKLKYKKAWLVFKTINLFFRQITKINFISFWWNHSINVFP